MATQETITILKVDTGEAVKNVSDLKNNIKLLKEALNEAEIGTEDYQKILVSLEENQYALKTAMHATTTGMEEITAAAMGVGESYNSLVKHMADLKEELRSVDVSTEEGKARFAELAGQINETNDKLKGMDASMGNYQRNVGNYASAISGLKGGFNGLSKAFIGAVDATGSLNGAFKTLAANPIVLIITVIAAILIEIVKAMKKSEEATAALNKVMAKLSVITDALTKVLQVLGEAITWVIDQVVSLVGALLGLDDAEDKRAAIVEKELELAERQRDALMKNADATLEIAKLKAEAADKEKYTAEERLVYLQKAADKEKEIALRSYEDLKLAYEIQKEKNALAASTAEEKEKEAQAYADMVNAYTAYYNKVKELNAQMSEAKKQIASDAKAAASAAVSARKDQLSKEKELLALQIANVEKYTKEDYDLQVKKAEKEHAIATYNAKTTIKNAKTLNATLAQLEKKHAKDMLALKQQYNAALEKQNYLHYQNLADQYNDNTKEYLKAMADLRKKQMDDVVNNGKLVNETAEEYNARRLAAQKAYYEAAATLKAKEVEQSVKDLELQMAESKNNQKAMLDLAYEYAKRQRDALFKMQGETNEEYAIRQQEAQNTLNEAMQAQADFADEQERLRWENKLGALRDGSMEKLRMQIEFDNMELDRIRKRGQLETETEAEFQARQLAAEQKFNESKAALAQARLDNTTSSASAASSLITSIADIYEATGENDVKAQKKAKALRIAGATVDTISGAVGAYMQSVKTIPPPTGVILGAANAAIVTATGVANIAKIANTDVSGSSTSSGSSSFTSTSAPAVSTPTQSVSVTSNSAEATLNKIANSTQRVYILQSDLEAANNTSKVQVAESSFV